jgi:hypothetical protein
MEPAVMTELLMSLAKLSPVFAILILWLWTTIKRLFEREAEITKLQEEIRASEKENMKLFKEVSETLINISNDTTNSNETVVREITNLKEYIKDKIK